MEDLQYRGLDRYNDFLKPVIEPFFPDIIHPLPDIKPVGGFLFGGERNAAGRVFCLFLWYSV
jgi:hypothetical protein